MATAHFDRQGRPRHHDVLKWMELLCLPRFVEYFVSVDHFPIWRRHLSWAKSSGQSLREHMTQRFASNMVFMSLLLSTEIAVLFSPSSPAEAMRTNLKDGEYGTTDFWAGLVLCTSIFLSLCTLVATFTAWAIISSVSDANAHCVLRSSVGLYGAQVPSRFVVMSIYAFLLWNILFMFILLPQVWAIVISVVACTLFVHIVSIYSSLGRLVMLTRAMGGERVLDVEEEESMMPYELYTTLLDRAEVEKKKRTNVMKFYRSGNPTQSSASPAASGGGDNDDDEIYLEEGNGSLHRRGKAQDSKASTS